MGFVLDLSTNILIITNKTKEYIMAWFKLNKFSSGTITNFTMLTLKI